MAKFIVSFIDKGNCEIIQVEVECFRPYNAAKVAFKKVEATHDNLINYDCVKINVEKID